MTYDLALSIGSACSCSTALRRAALQYVSFPLDWVFGSDIRRRADVVTAGCPHWMDRDLMERFSIPAWEGMAIWRNRQTGITFNHEFPDEDGSFDRLLGEVQAKYSRRISRMMSLLGSASRVLLVWVGVPRNDSTSLEDALYCQRKFGEKWANAEFDVLIVRCVEGVPFSRKIIREPYPHIRVVEFDYLPKGDVPHWYATIDTREFSRWLAKEYVVRDYRTEHERCVWKVHRRKSELAKYGAYGWYDYLPKKWLYKIRKHFAVD